MTADLTVRAFVGGALCIGWLVIALCFAKFWRRRGDPLFAAFAAAFVLLAVNQALSVFLRVGADEEAGVYLLRLAAFALIIYGIVRKNLASRRR
jgi:hypothetical protein